MLMLTILMVFTSGLWAQENDQVYVTAVAWSHDGSKIAAVGIRQPMTQGYLRVVDVQTGEILYSVDPDPGGFTSVDWSPDDRFIATYSIDGFVRLWEVETGMQLDNFPGITRYPSQRRTNPSMLYVAMKRSSGLQSKP